MERSTTDGVHIWLAQALATPWSSSVLAPELTDDILAHVMHAWSAYDTNTKTGLLFAFLCVKKGQMTPMRERVLQLLDIACKDPDEWTRVVASIIRQFPTQGTLNFDVQTITDRFGETFDKLRESIRNSGVNFHPSEFAFMNLSARASYPSASTTFRSFTPSTKSHFKLKENTNATISREDRLAKLRKLAGPEHRTSSAGLPGAVGSSGLSRHALLQQAPAPGAGALFINRPQVQRKQSLPNFLRASVPPKVSPINTQPKASIAQALTSPSINSSSFFGTQPMAVDGQGSPSTISPTLPGSSTTTTVAAGSAVVGSGSGNRPRGFIKPTKVQILDFEATKQLLNESQSTMDKIAHDEQQQKEAKRKEAKDRTEEKRRAEEEKKREREREREERKERKRAAEEETRRTRERERGEREEREREREMVREMEREERDREIEEADPDEAEKEREKEREREDDGEKGRKRRRSSGTSSKKSVSRDALMISDGEIEDDGQPGSSTVPLHPLAIPVSTNSNSFGSELTASPTSAYPVANAATTRIITDTAVPEPSLPTDLSMPVGYASFIAPNGVMPELPLLAMQADINAQVFERTNKLSEEGRAMITDFLAGKIITPPFSATYPTHRVLMNEEVQPDPVNPARHWIETIEFEMNFDNGSWKKIRKRRGMKVRSAASRNTNGVTQANGNVPHQADMNGVTGS